MLYTMYSVHVLASGN